MKNHQAKHSGETPWLCGQCDQRFSTRASHRRHQRLYCSGGKPEAKPKAKGKRKPEPLAAAHPLPKKKRRKTKPDAYPIPASMVFHVRNPCTRRKHPCIQCGAPQACRAKYSRCSTCAPYTGSSFTEHEFLKAVRDEMGVHDLIFGNAGEQYRVPNTPYRVDGYSPSRRTIYEYHSAKYHGTSDKCISRLQTLKRMDALCALGYTVFCVWGRSFLRRPKGQSIEAYLERHQPPCHHSARALPALDAEEARVVKSMTSFLVRQRQTKSRFASKTELANLLDYAIMSVS